ncbi:MAG: T9SS type A sorting domain-containing protein [Saprospiraceae bacterium]|nr:T9SS type A sorting domain-containing protein [Saprospiraceae bacterium]
MKALYLKFSLLVLLSVCFAPKIFSQEFGFIEIPNPTGYTYAVRAGHLNGIEYLAYYDLSTNLHLFSFDGQSLVQIDNPSGLVYGYQIHATTTKLYLVYYDQYFHPYLFEFDGTSLTAITTSSSDEYVNGFVFELNDQLYFSYNNLISLTASLKRLDGLTMVDIALPSGLTFGYGIGTLSPNSVIALYDLSFNSQVYTFDGINFAPVASPGTTDFFLPMTTLNGLLYIGFYNVNFTLQLYAYDGNGFFEIPVPAGLSFQNYNGKLDGLPYFSFYDPVNAVSTLYRLENSGWTEIPNPPSYYFGFVTNETDTHLYTVYLPEFSFEQTLGLYDGADFQLIPNIPEYQYNSYLVDYENGFFAAYYDLNFQGNLQYFNGTEMLLVPPPNPDYAFQNFAFELNDEYYFSFFETDTYKFHLYRLGDPNVAPTAADNTVTTLQETPYVFDYQDFNFADLNPADELAAVQIVSLPDNGYLHVNGGNVSVGLIVEGTDIELLTFVPDNNGIGTPYTSLQFKVSDGVLFSDSEYTMYVNVVTSVSSVDQELKSAFVVSPNPNQGVFQLLLDPGFNESNILVELFDSQGMLVEQRQLATHSEIFNLKDLAKGLYYLSVKTQYGKTVQKILIQ